MPTTLPLSGPSSDAPARHTLSNLSLAVAKSKKIVVVTGAGISCSCGIPDFRSSDGLYNLVKQQYPDVVLKGRDLFDASLFRDATSASVFYTFIAKLKQSVDSVDPSPTHHFIKALDLKGKLLRSYTQNIDGLEERVGLAGSSNSSKGKGKMKAKEIRNVQLHGDIRQVRCTLCSANFPFNEEYTTLFLQGIAPECPECVSRSEARVARSARAIRVGSLRPAIVLYDEPHPLGDDIGSIQTADLARKPDLLIIMGTSLKVHGLKKLVKEFSKAVHASAPVPKDESSSQGNKGSRKSAGTSMKGTVIFVNKTPPSSEWDGIIDYHIEGDTDAWTSRVLDDWKKMRPADWEVQTTLVESNIFKAEKTNALVKNIKNGKSTGRHGQDDREDVENVPPHPVMADKTSQSVKSRSGKASKAADNGHSHSLKVALSKSKINQGFAADKKRKTRAAMDTDVDSANDPFSNGYQQLTTTTTSPGKRRQRDSHYSSADNTVECSPSKKRISEERVIVPSDERKLLFSRQMNTTINKEKDEVADVSMVSCHTFRQVSVDIDSDHLARVKREYAKRAESTNSLFGLGGEFSKTTLDEEEGFEFNGDMSGVILSVDA